MLKWSYKNDGEDSGEDGGKIKYLGVNSVLEWEDRYRLASTKV